MSTQTPNLNLDLREGTDIFNPLSTNSNFETLDSVITEIRKKGGVPTYTTTASANLLKLSENPVPNETLFKFVAAGDANTWSFQETVNNIVTLDGKQKTVKGGEMYVAWVNAANAMVVVAWPDVVDAQTFNGKGPAEWASKAQLDAVNQTAVNATTTAQAAATVANNALDVAQKAGVTITNIYNNPTPAIYDYDATHPEIVGAKMLFITAKHTAGAIVTCPPIINGVETTSLIVGQTVGNFLSGTLKIYPATATCTINWETGKITINNFASASLPSSSGASAGNAGFGVTRLDILK